MAVFGGQADAAKFTSLCGRSWLGEPAQGGEQRSRAGPTRDILIGEWPLFKVLVHCSREGDADDASDG